jgi:sensor histidine kinase YesM
MNPINFNFLQAIVLPALIYSSVMSLVVAVIIVGTIASAIERRKDRSAIQIIPNPILFPIYGSFIGLMLLTFLPIQADRAFRTSGMYAGIWLVQKLIVLAPLGSILGATTGCIVGKQLNRKVNLQHMWIGLGITYSIMAFTIYTSLVPPPM